MARYIWGSKRPLQAIKVVILSANSPFDVAKIRTYFVTSKLLRLFLLFCLIWKIIRGHVFGFDFYFCVFRDFRVPKVKIVPQIFGVSGFFRIFAVKI